LLSRIAEHDIGFAGDLPTIRSRDLTVTNKILQYLLGGLAVVASDTAGQREVAEKAPGAVLLYPSGDSVALAAQLNALLNSPQRLQGAKAAALQAAQTVFCWERQEQVLVDLVERALDAASASARR
jgi:glycosyltransferase involved in cell wall biosynthesis